MHLSTRRMWQDRPLPEELVTCAAADVAYLVPLMELQVRLVAYVRCSGRMHLCHTTGFCPVFWMVVFVLV
jgi:ribonuclease D